MSIFVLATCKRIERNGMSCSAKKRYPFCNCFTLSEEGDLANGLPKKLLLYGNRGIILKDFQTGNQNTVYFDYSKTEHSKGLPSFGPAGMVMSAEPAQGQRFGEKLLVSKGNYNGVIIFVDALSLDFGTGLQDTSDTPVSGALVCRKGDHHKDGWLRAGELTSWSKQQLCILDDPEDHMFVVDQKLRVLLLEVTRLHIQIRFPTPDEMSCLYKETEILMGIDEP